MIIDGELRKGDKLPGERELAQRFEVSRASIREALKILSLQGLLHRTNARTVVTTDFLNIIEETLTLKILLEDSSYSDIIAARLALEKSMVILAAKEIKKMSLSCLKSISFSWKKQLKQNQWMTSSLLILNFTVQ